MTVDAPIRAHRETVIRDWVDYNGHLNVAYYVLIFDHATDVMLNLLGIGPAYVESGRGMIFVVESHITYDRELMLDQTVSVTTQLLGRDAKRLRFFHEMWAEPVGGGEPFLAATLDNMALHVDHESRRVAAFPDDRASAIEAMWQAHRVLPRPERAGRTIADLKD